MFITKLPLPVWPPDWTSIRYIGMDVLPDNYTHDPINDELYHPIYISTMFHSASYTEEACGLIKYEPSNV